MENLIIDALKEYANFTNTENGALAHKTTNSAVYDMFALGGAYRTRSVEDTILLFKNAYEENKNLALKCLFYLRDVRGGQGERQFFRTCFNWLCKTYPNDARKLYTLLPEYGRYDDLWYATEGTELFRNAIALIEDQLALDLDSKTPSLLAKWLPSENTSSYTTRDMGRKIRKALGLSSKVYRKQLSTLRNRIKVVETLMSENRWDEIEFDKIPSKAGIIYKNAFARRDMIAKKYEHFVKSTETTVNAKTLYPYEIISQVTKTFDYWGDTKMDELDRLAVEKYWNNLPNYLEGGKNKSILCVVDTSGSMDGRQASAPINIAIGLGMYAGERCTGPFKDHYISFSSRPQLIKIEGVDFADKVRRIYKTNLCENTNLTGVFDLLKNIALSTPGAAADLPDTIVVISDMEIDSGANGENFGWYSTRDTFHSWTSKTAATEMEKIRQDWASVGLKLPKLVYWNVEARNNTILDSGDSVSFVSGASPIIFEQICKGKTGYELMLDKLLTDRYEQVKVED